MRVLFLLIFLAGAAAGIGAPFVLERFADAQIGTFRAYEPATGFRAVSLPLRSGDAPVEVYVDLQAPAPFVPDQALTSVSVTAAKDGKTVFANAVAFRDASMHDDNPQTPERSFRVLAGTLGTVEDGKYTFTATRGETEIAPVTAIDLVLQRGASGIDRRVQPLGFAAMAVGFIGFMLAQFRRVPAAGPNAPAPRPRWGRNASVE